MHGSKSKILSKNSCTYISDVNFLALLAAPCIYEISELRVKRDYSHAVKISLKQFPRMFSYNKESHEERNNSRVSVNEK
jgi:hypothetical protein